MKTRAVIRQLFVSFQGLKSPKSSWNQPVLAAWRKSPSRQPIATKTTNYLLCAEATQQILTPRPPPYAGEIWKRRTGFTLKTHGMFFAHTTPEKFENRTITGIFFNFCLENSARENVFWPHENEKGSFSNSSGRFSSKSVSFLIQDGMDGWPNHKNRDNFGIETQF